MGRYVRFCRGLTTKGKLLLESEVESLLDLEHDFYQSIYYYNDDQYKQFQETKTIKGIRDVVTDQLVFDFDNEKNPDIARQNAQQLIFKLTPLGVAEKDIQIYYSGNKGVNIVLT